MHELHKPPLVHPYPPIELEQATLRPWQASDAEVLAGAWQDTDIARFNDVPDNCDVEVASRWIEGVDQRLRDRLSVDLVIVEGVNGLEGGVVGEVGLAGFDWSRRAAMIGYWLLASARGRGLATSAVRAFVGWAHSGLGLDLIVARCHRLNLSSQRVAERSGFVYRSDHGPDYQLWAHQPHS